MADGARARTTSFADQKAGAAPEINPESVSGVIVTDSPDGRGKITTVVATSGGSPARTQEISYANPKIIGNGSFGVVFEVTLLATGERCAIKKVLQDKRFKNRELQIMRMLQHENVVEMNWFFYSNGQKEEEIYLNLVLEYVPETIYQVARHYSRAKQQFPGLHTKLYTYQMFRALAYIHHLGICHRDIKPQNLLVNSNLGVLKLCDFGSAKRLVSGEPNVSYICSRYYRAPELIFGATNYSTAIDVWSAGCVLAELLLGQPIFPGENGVDQLVEIIKVLGTPTKEEIAHMNPNYTEFKFPQIPRCPWDKVFRNRVVTPESADLCSKLLEYIPTDRISLYDSMLHPFFNELRDPATKFDGKDLPPLFNFTEDELSDPGFSPDLIPPHAR
mmetsp:Transcript_146555/g.207850  ORF Transcript_146555/g.207850 Transcript_146555/m.207850 type:complete len:389 (-) Transcript_146555:124-1290(-)